jgi:hypothetical protein
MPLVNFVVPLPMALAALTAQIKHIAMETVQNVAGVVVLRLGRAVPTAPQERTSDRQLA